MMVLLDYLLTGLQIRNVGVVMVKEESSQSKNSCVLELAKELKKDKWEVKANLEGWNKPSTYGSTVPDIEAKKEGCLTRICEVVTEEMFAGNRAQYQDLKNYCDEYDFHMYVVKNGQRVELNKNELSKLKEK